MDLDDRNGEDSPYLFADCGSCIGSGWLILKKEKLDETKKIFVCFPLPHSCVSSFDILYSHWQSFPGVLTALSDLITLSTVDSVLLLQFSISLAV